MPFNETNLRKRFNSLRKAARWRWKDIDEITGRKNARSNIAKRVPAWSHLAIHLHEEYAVILRQHIIALVALHLGPEWSLKQLSYGRLYFIRDKSTIKDFAGINLEFYDGGFKLTSDHLAIYELTKQLSPLYPSIGTIIPEEGGFSLDVPIIIGKIDFT
jgi:hypothetical protein